MKQLLTLVFLLCFIMVYAQPGDPGGGQDPDVPITGIEWLLGGGILFGLKSILSKRRKR